MKVIIVNAKTGKEVKKYNKAIGMYTNNDSIVINYKNDLGEVCKVIHSKSFYNVMAFMELGGNNE